ncbi:MAG: sensor histidine kinase [Salibacteraceae bacterium]
MKTFVVIILCFGLISSAFAQQSEYERALENLQKVQEGSKDESGQLLEFIYANLGKFPQLSQKAVDRLLHRLKSQPNDSLAVLSYRAAADNYRQLNLPDSAFNFYFRALEKAEQNADYSSQIKIYRSLYELYHILAMDELVFKTILKLRDLLQHDLGSEEKARIYLTLNNFHDYFGDVDSCRIFLDSAEKYLENSTNKGLKQIVLNDRAIDRFNDGDTLGALETYTSLISDTASSNIMSNAFHNAILIYSWLEAFDEADSLAQLAIKVAENDNDLEEIIGAYYDAAILNYEAGNYRKAFNYYEQMDVFDDSLYNIQISNAVAEAQTKYDLAQREAEIAVQMAQRNFFFALTLLLIVLITASVIVYGNRLRTNRKLAEQRIAKLEKEKEVLSLQSMLFAQEQERQRIARDLHDSIGALLSTAKLHLSNIEEEVKKLAGIDFLKSTGEIIDRAGEEVRRVAHDMMPGVLMKLGLLEGIEDFFERVRKSSNMIISFTYDEPERRLNNKHEVMIYRIVQELVNNTLKHAEADEIKLMIKHEKNQLKLDYRDDGKGFNRDLIREQNSFGLGGIKSRVNFLEGELKLNSTAGNGVHFEIAIPIVNA